ncbi:MAG: AMP-binding protein [Rikenellaceae bacterium]
MITDKTLHGWLEYWVEQQPDNDFMVYPDRGLRLSYYEFNQRANRLAKGLQHIGVGYGDKVGVWAKNIPDWMTLMFACSKIGAVLVTVNTNYKVAEVEYVMQNADIHTMCIMNGYRDSDYVQIIGEVVPELKKSRRGDLHCKKLPELRNVVYMGAEKHRGMYNTAELILLGGQLSDSVLEPHQAKIDVHSVVNMQYTSGTTGFPKGVMLTHANIVTNGISIGDCMSYTPADRLLVCVPLFHCFGCVLGVCSVITHGSTMVMVEDFDPLKVLASVQSERCTSLYGVPTMFIAELSHPMFEMFDLSTLRTGIMAGAPCPIEYMNQVMQKMNCRDIISVYGLTETSPGMTATRVTDSPEIRATTVGRSLPNMDVVVKDPETGEILPSGMIGEMCCRGYNVMKGYYNNPEATAAVIDDEGFLHSGDLGVMDEHGYVRITGRIKEMIIRGGENVYPREIENFLLTLPKILDVQVAGLPSEKYGEQVAAYVRVKEGETLTEAEIVDFCRGNIARYKIPKFIFFVDTYPMTASGKIQKYLLKDLGLAELEKRGVTVE